MRKDDPAQANVDSGGQHSGCSHPEYRFKDAGSRAEPHSHQQCAPQAAPEPKLRNGSVCPWHTSHCIPKSCNCCLIPCEATPPSQHKSLHVRARTCNQEENGCMVDFLHLPPSPWAPCCPACACHHGLKHQLRHATASQCMLIPQARKGRKQTSTPVIHRTGGE